MDKNAGHKNLIPQNMRTKDEQRRIARAGGIASGKARRERKRMRDMLLELLETPSRKGRTDDIEAFNRIRGLNLTGMQRLAISMLRESFKGNVRAAEFVRDTIGEAPAQKLRDVTGEEDEDERSIDELIAIATGGDAPSPPEGQPRDAERQGTDGGRE